MKLLVVHPGASWSTHDCFVAMVESLRAGGIGVAEFRLDGRIQRTHDFLHFLWRRQRREDRSRAWPKPTPADVLLQASSGLIERALERRCDAILVVTAMFLQPDMLVLARRAGLKVFLYCTESPYDLAHELPLAALADGVWTNERTAVEPLRTVCPNVAYLPHAWRRGTHDQAQPSDAGLPAHDVVFVGSFFEERVALLEAVDWTGIDVGLYGMTELLRDDSPLHRHVRGAITPNGIAAGLYRRAKVGLNLYRTTPPEWPAGESLNPRAYELAAAGVAVVSQYRAEVGEVFGNAVPTFETAAELERAVRALLANPGQRHAYAARAQGAVAGSTWDSRIEQMRRDLDAWGLASTEAAPVVRSA